MSDPKKPEEKKVEAAEVVKEIEAALDYAIEKTTNKDEKTLFQESKPIAKLAVKGIEKEFYELSKTEPGNADYRDKVRAYENALMKKHDIDSLADLLSKEDTKSLSIKERGALMDYYLNKGSLEMLKDYRDKDKPREKNIPRRYGLATPGDDEVPHHALPHMTRSREMLL